jgi:hypothetical protein
MPRYTVVIHELAVLDIQEAIDWYNKQSSGFGKSFLNKVKK